MIRCARSPKRHGSRVLNGLSLECRRVIGENTPNWVQRTVELVVLVAEEVPADVVAPPAVADVARGRGEVRLEVQRRPRDHGVAGEADRVAVAADPGVAGERQGPLAVSPGVQEVVVVEQPERIEPGNAGDPALLPVEPPEVDALGLARMVQLLEVGLQERGVGGVEVDGQLAVGVDAHPPRDRGVALLVGVHALGRVHVQRGRQPALVQGGEERRRVGEQVAVPGVAGPAAAVARVDVDEVPVHVQHRHRQRDALGGEAVHQAEVLVGGVGVVAAPPVAQREARQQRLRAGQVVEGAQRGAVVAAVGEDVEVEGVRAARRDPAVVGEQHRGAVVVAGHAVAGEHAGLQRDGAVGLVEGPRGPAEVGRGQPEPPHAALGVQAALRLHRQPLGAERALVVDQLQPRGVDRQPVVGLDDVELGGRERAVDDGLARPVLELAGRAVLQPDEAVGQHADAVAVAGEDAGGIGDRVPGRAKVLPHEHLRCVDRPCGGS